MTISHGPWEAVIVEVGGGLRNLSRGGAAVLEGYAEDEMASGGRGQPLLPWPNRLAGGAYEFDGRRIQAPLTEPSKGNAIHGLTRWSNWTVEGGPGGASATSRLRLNPQPAYPFTLDLEIGYALADDGLTVTLRATNAGDGPAPFGAGFHPYLTAGSALVDEDTLTVPAATWLPAGDTGIPTGEHRDAEGDLYLRDGRVLGDIVLDHCFTDLGRDGSGRAAVKLEGASGRVVLWMDEAFPFCMVFTGDTLSADRRRRSVAVEPMTCAADAFTSGDGLVTLAPGETFTGMWGVVAEVR